ncbi:MAG TPA: hypothetical protein VLF42_03105 [Burkholderiales bacterium]|nr:hypothetical protein [Burkholderiales bacterium]
MELAAEERLDAVAAVPLQLFYQNPFGVETRRPGLDLGEVGVLAGEPEQVGLLGERQPLVDDHGEAGAARLAAARRRQRYHGERVPGHSQESGGRTTKAYTMRKPWTDALSYSRSPQRHSVLTHNPGT